MNEVSSLLGSSLLVPIGTAATAFTATNLDDIIILLLFFSQLGERLKAVHVVGGQFLGFTLLVLASLAGFVGSLLIPEEWIGLLGLLPISIGISRLIEVLQGGDGGDEFQANPSEREGFWRSWPLAEVFSVAAITVANGGDNIGIYLPLFAHATTAELVVILVVFYLLMGAWCLIAWQLTQAPALADGLGRYGHQLIPFVLLGLGALILIDSHTLDHRGLAVFSLCCVGLMLSSVGRQLRQMAHESSLLAHLPRP